MTAAPDVRETAPGASAVPEARVSRGGRLALVGPAAVVVVLAVLATLPYAVGPSVTSPLIELFYLITLATMWNLLAGYAGMLSVGQQAYIGLGAYALFVVNDFGINPYLGTLIASVLVAIIAIPVSFIAFRLRGGYFAVATWVIAEVARLTVVQFDVLGAGRGRTLESFTEEPLLRRAYTFWLALAVVTLAILVTYALLRSRLGLHLQAVRDDSVAAGSLGVRVTRVKRLVFVLTAGGCAAAGAVICVEGLGVASPNVIFGVQYSAFMIFMVVIGGIGTIEGPVVGALIFYGLDRYFSQQGVWYLVALGAVAIAITLLAPRGLWGEFAHRTGFSVFPLAYRVVPLIPPRHGSTATAKERS